jgi:hypothetical protein
VHTGDGAAGLAAAAPFDRIIATASTDFSWRRLGKPGIDKFGVTALDDPALQYVWFDQPDSQHRWPLPL